MQGTFVNLCYTMENHAIATMMTYFGSTDHKLGTEIDRGRWGMSSKNRLESLLIYIYIYIYIYICIYIYTYDQAVMKAHLGEVNPQNKTSDGSTSINLC